MKVITEYQIGIKTQNGRPKKIVKSIPEILDHIWIVSPLFADLHM